MGYRSLARIKISDLYISAYGSFGYWSNLSCCEEVFVAAENENYILYWPEMKRFFIQSTSLTIIVLILGATVYSTLLKSFYNVILPILLIFFYVATNLVHALLLKIAVKSGSKFTSQYMAISFIKMFFYLALAVVYALLNREYAKIFLVNFLVLYAIYTTFEVMQFSKFVRQKNT